MTRMRAVRYSRYGGPEVLDVVDVATPIPGAGEVVVRVASASLNPLDYKIRAGELRLLPVFAPPPRGTGVDFAGTIVAIGGGAGPRHVGERVFGSLSPFPRQGSCAEAVVVPAARLTPIPQAVSDEDAATLPIAGGAALQALCDDAKLAAGQRVLITGAAGGVGHFAVQIAKHAGAQVVASCGTTNVEFVRSLGADAVHDYTTGDVLAEPVAPFDVVFDVAESIGWRRARSVLAGNGLYIGTAGSTAKAIAAAIGAIVSPWTGRTRVRTLVLRGGPQVNARLVALVAERALVPHIARRVTLDELADAQRAMETRHGRGKIVVLPQVST